MPILTRRHRIPLVVTAVALTLGGCATTTDPYTRKQKTSETANQAAQGAAAGALVGGLACLTNGGRRCGETIAIVAAAGALGGAMQGAAHDAHDARLLEEFRAAGISVRESGSNAVLETKSGILFAQNSAQPNGTGMRHVSSIAKVLRHYPAYGVLIVGHTSSDEPSSLASERANSVAAALGRMGVARQRIEAQGSGLFGQLRAETLESGRATNRSVEILLKPKT